MDWQAWWNKNGAPIYLREICFCSYEVIPAKLVAKVHVRKKYGPCNCDDFIGNDEPAVITAPGPVKLLRGSPYSNNTAAFILVNKFVDGIPLYRQEAAFKRMGLDLGRGTMARQVLRISAELDVLWQSMKADLRASPVLGMDETTTQVIHEDGRSASSPSWMWVARGFTTGRHPIIWFEYADSRSGDVAQSILVFDAILTWLQTQETKYLPSGPLGSAIQYALGQYRRAIRYVDHWLLTPDNNPVEMRFVPL